MDDRPAFLSVDRPPAHDETLTGPGWGARIDRTGLVVTLDGDWIAREGTRTEDAAASRILEAAGGGALTFDCAALGRWDSALLLFLTALRHAAKQRGVAFDTEGLPAAATRLLALAAEGVPAPAPAARRRLLSRVGRPVLNSGHELVAVMAMIGDTVLSGAPALRGRLRMRTVDLLTHLYETGAAALPIVTIANALTGAIVAFVGSVQLRLFGADILVADLVCIAMVREMAALMTAIVMAGRTGGAFAANIATMVGNEEIDALQTIGIPIHDYLILPRLIALTCMMPLLYLYGCAVGIFGGFAISVVMLNLSPDAFITEARGAMGASHLLLGLAKSVTFGALIAIVGCRAGLRAGRSAADVGRAATSAVVIGIVGIIAIDAVFAICANALGI